MRSYESDKSHIFILFWSNIHRKQELSQQLFRFGVIRMNIFSMFTCVGLVPYIYIYIYIYVYTSWKQIYYAWYRILMWTEDLVCGISVGIGHRCYNLANLDLFIHALQNPSLYQRHTINHHFSYAWSHLWPTWYEWNAENYSLEAAGVMPIFWGRIRDVLVI